MSAKGGLIRRVSSYSSDLSGYCRQTAARNQVFYEVFNSLKKRGTQAARVGTFPGGTTICTHCEEVGRTASHRKNACYFEQKKLTDRNEWARKLMDEKGMTCNYDE